MFKGDSKLLETSLYSPKTNTSRLGHKRAVRTSFCPLRIGLCQGSVARNCSFGGARTVATVTLFQHFPETAQQLYFRIPNDPQR